MSLAEKLFGSFSDRELKKINPLTKQVLALEGKYQAMSDAELQAQTPVLKQKLADGKTLDDILPDAFAVCREAAWRVLGMKHFPVQVTGGIALHRGDIAEMQTGEGKTLVATLPAYLNALTGEGVHIVTVNDYLAKRDSEWMGKLYRWLGLSVGLIVQGMDGDARREAYNADITYGTNNEFGFDYLRDNMVTYKDNMVQRGHAYAVVDEVDSILIDEARTPLIISGRGEDSSSLYTQVDRFVRTLRKSVVVELEDKVETDEQADGDYVVDEKHKTCTLTAKGIKKAEEYFKIENLAAAENMTLAHHIDQAIKAYGVMQRDIDYVVKDGEVLIVDEFTGRLMIGRRYNEGLHQAIEAKEGVKVEAATQTFATITLQNYFRMYHKLAGMTGTAETEAGEFWDIYKLDVVTIPTNKPVARIDMNDRVYKTKKEKYAAVIDEIVNLVEQGRPVLVGTTSVEISELLSRMLTLRRIPHNVLNAKLHQREAEIVAQAGKKGTVTIATNMAGRGTDIKLPPEVKEAGGLAIIGTERHESRRVDRQLRGRSGRQGDPGSSVFYLSFEDQLMRLFATDRVTKMLDTLGIKEGEMIESKMVNRAIENAQKRVEENNFGVRKRLLEYDDVMNKQRQYIYGRRHHALMGERIGIDINNMLYDTVENIVNTYDSPADYADLSLELLKVFAVETPFTEDEFRSMPKNEAFDRILASVNEAFRRKSDRIIEIAMPVISEWVEKRDAKGRILVPITDGKRVFNIPADITETYNSKGKALLKEWHKAIMLVTIDEVWKEHLRELDQLRQSVQNASYEQKDPLVIYKVESFHLFENAMNTLNVKAVSALMRGQIFIPQQRAEDARLSSEQDRQQPAQRQPEVKEAMPDRPNDYSRYRASREQYPGSSAQRQAASAPQGEQQRTQPIINGPKVGRNDPCPCGSGKKFKNCHGRNA